MVLNLVLIWFRKKENYTLKVYQFVSELSINLDVEDEDLFNEDKGMLLSSEFEKDDGVEIIYLT